MRDKFISRPNLMSSKTASTTQTIASSRYVFKPARRLATQWILLNLTCQTSDSASTAHENTYTDTCTIYESYY